MNLLSHTTVLMPITLAALLTGCASERSIAYNKAQEERAKQEAEQRREEARQRMRKRDEARKAFETRVAAGEKGPTPPQDPGYPIVKCNRPPPNGMIFSGGMFGDILPSSEWLCGNSPLGAQVLAYREWYCGGKKAECVLGRWRDGAPTFGQLLRNTVNTIEPLYF